MGAGLAAVSNVTVLGIEPSHLLFVNTWQHQVQPVGNCIKGYDTVPEMTYNVSSGTLSLYTLKVSQVTKYKYIAVQWLFATDICIPAEG